MVDILPPPPLRTPTPVYYDLARGTQLFRIFDPTSHGATAVGFRANGPRARFDHHHSAPDGSPTDNETRAIVYAGFTLSCCIVEYFGDRGSIVFGECRIAGPHLTRRVHLLDLRGDPAMAAGSVAALAKTADRALSQSWSRYFYEHSSTYRDIDGIIFYNAHNDETAVALYERCAGALVCAPHDDMRLDDRRLRPSILEVAIRTNLGFP